MVDEEDEGEEKKGIELGDGKNLYTPHVRM